MSSTPLPPPSSLQSAFSSSPFPLFLLGFLLCPSNTQSPWGCGCLPSAGDPVTVTHCDLSLQALQEEIAISGCKMRLSYLSSRTPGYKSVRRIRLTHPTIPFNLMKVHLMVAVEGRLFRKWFAAAPDLSYYFIWDKTDVYNQKVFGLSEAFGKPPHRRAQRRPQETGRFGGTGFSVLFPCLFFLPFPSQKCLRSSWPLGAVSDRPQPKRMYSKDCTWKI